MPPSLLLPSHNCHTRGNGNGNGLSTTGGASTAPSERLPSPKLLQPRSAHASPSLLGRSRSLSPDKLSSSLDYSGTNVPQGCVAEQTHPTSMQEEGWHAANESHVPRADVLHAVAEKSLHQSDEANVIVLPGQSCEQEHDEMRLEAAEAQGSASDVFHARHMS
jgi:hypothetical protein